MFSREDKAEKPELDALATTGPGRRIDIDERPLDCVLPIDHRALWAIQVDLKAKAAR